MPAEDDEHGVHRRKHRPELETAGGVFAPSSNASTVPYGFLLEHEFCHLDTVTHVVYNYARNMFVSLDDKGTRWWTYAGEQRRMRYPGPHFGLIRSMIYDRRNKVFFVAHTNRQLEVMDSDFSSLASVESGQLAIMQMVFNADTGVLVTAGVGLRVWQYESRFAERMSITEKPRRIHTLTHLRDLMPPGDTNHRWIMTAHWHTSGNRLYVAWEGTLAVFCTRTWTRLRLMQRLHEQSITAIGFYPLLDYIITGSKDSSIKIWSSTGALVKEFDNHARSITGLIMHPVDGMVVTSSLDHTVRIIHLETLQVMYRFKMDTEAMSIQLLDRHRFFVRTAKSVRVLAFNQVANVYAITRSPVQILRRYAVPGRPPRLLALCEDSAVYVLSGRDGSSLTTTLVPASTHRTLDFAYNYDRERLYLLLRSGEVWVYVSTS